MRGGRPSLPGQAGPLCRMGPGQFSQNPRQVHFGFSSLETTLDRGLELALSLGARTPSPKRSESRRKSSAGASVITLIRFLTATWPAAGNRATR